MLWWNTVFYVCGKVIEKWLGFIFILSDASWIDMTRVKEQSKKLEEESMTKVLA